MTLQERIKAQETAMKDVKALAGIVDRIKGFHCTVNLQKPDGYGTGSHIKLTSQCWIDNGQGTFSSVEVPLELLIHFISFQEAIDDCLKKHGAILVAQIEAKIASLLLSPVPTVTVQSNGVNVEVK